VGRTHGLCRDGARQYGENLRMCDRAPAGPSVGGGTRLPGIETASSIGCAGRAPVTYFTGGALSPGLIFRWIGQTQGGRHDRRSLASKGILEANSCLRGRRNCGHVGDVYRAAKISNRTNNPRPPPFRARLHDRARCSRAVGA
jgi:hypothetical protein